MRYRKRPSEVEAIQIEDFNQLYDITGGEMTQPVNGVVGVITASGTSCVVIGDWIIKDEHGALSTCKRDEFEDEYEQV